MINTNAKGALTLFADPQISDFDYIPMERPSHQNNLEFDILNVNLKCCPNCMYLIYDIEDNGLPKYINKTGLRPAIESHLSSMYSCKTSNGKTESEMLFFIIIT